jgi:hypothetical protein
VDLSLEPAWPLFWLPLCQVWKKDGEEMNEIPEISGYKIAGLFLIEPMRDDQYVPGKPFYSNGVVLEPVYQLDGGVLWAIRKPYQSPGQCLNKKGEWEFEPLPSSRTNSFFRRCRFGSIEGALRIWETMKEKNA